jgi:uncharacterized membrane protein YgdD (TMEM256/DUF423 family)
MRLGSLAAMSMIVAVACGAFGAHALRDSLSVQDMAIWEKAVLYQLAHSMAALVVALVGPLYLSARRAQVLAGMFLSSVVIFSGSLYVLVLTNTRWLGMITPLGGIGFMVTWLLVALFLWRSKGITPS